MAKIDTSKIEGYAEMTPEQKIAALEAVEYDDKSSELERYKNAASKANSEAAEWKKKHNALLSEEEKAKQAREDELAALREKVETMEKEKAVSNNKVQFLSLGLEDELAADTAKAMSDGDNTKVFANLKKFLEVHDKAYKAQLMASGSKPPAGDSGGETMTLDKLRKMSPSERYEFSQKNPEEYKNLYGGNE
jgi:hypothetical protein